ncbi:uncharacterized protein EV422DRAFT_401945 [Fimicolochytrium jonesii]|uniref:uncharacterized protein n=1 Tax=Fimicolochytrium jonesii TaxID=1396493 RepID=UPI0022FF432A|nr:uncharacterized protein EV422DRAFT_401945 [Fimicolochytrium jonesii]KAI8822512.1 hypothetical protein EV422DRAFT_401945 [Fimicolochytrium jonesii]
MEDAYLMDGREPLAELGGTPREGGSSALVGWIPPEQLAIAPSALSPTSADPRDGQIGESLSVLAKTAAKRRIAGAASVLPHELLLTIFEEVDELSTLHRCCLVNRAWNTVAQEVLWREVLLENATRVRRFVRGVAFSAAPRNPRRSGRTRTGLAVPKSFEGLGDLLKPGFLEFANGASRRLGTVVGNRAILPVGLEPSVSNALIPSSAESQVKQASRKGLGSMVKKLIVSSSEQKVILLQHVSNLLNNLQSLQFQHLCGEGVAGPSLDPRILTSMEPVIQRVSSLTIEDVDSPCWPDLCRILREHGGNLRNLNIEAVKDIDAFESTSDLSDVFPNMTGLEFIRLDGIPVGPNASIERLVSSCRNLTAVTLDYCLEITMDVLVVIWNGCPMLDFLGMAGVVGPMSAGIQLDHRPSLKTLRLVDCDVFDEMFEEVAKKATNLEMLRLVFEDEECEGIVLVSSELTDRSLRALATYTNTLQILALTRCPNMSAKALAEVIRRNPVHTLDLHKHPECSIGKFDDTYLRELAPAFNKVKVLNLYGQTVLTESCISGVVRDGFWSGLQSLSINNLTVGPGVLDAIRESCPLLEVISLVDCPNIAGEAAEGFAQGRPVWHIKPPNPPTEAGAEAGPAVEHRVDAATDTGGDPVTSLEQPPPSQTPVDDQSHLRDESTGTGEASQDHGPAQAAGTPIETDEYIMVDTAPSPPGPSSPVVSASHDTEPSNAAPSSSITSSPLRLLGRISPPSFFTPEPFFSSAPSNTDPVESPRAATAPSRPPCISASPGLHAHSPEDGTLSPAASHPDGTPLAVGTSSIAPACRNTCHHKCPAHTPPAPLRYLHRVYTLATDVVESHVIKHCDCWFVDEGLDITSLWESAVRRSAGRGWLL